MFWYHKWVGFWLEIYGLVIPIYLYLRFNWFCLYFYMHTFGVQNLCVHVWVGVWVCNTITLLNLNEIQIFFVNSFILSMGRTLLF